MHPCLPGLLALLSNCEVMTHCSTCAFFTLSALSPLGHHGCGLLPLCYPWELCHPPPCSPLGCLLENLQPLHLAPNLASKLTRLCSRICLQYPLDNQSKCCQPSHWGNGKKNPLFPVSFFFAPSPVCFCVVYLYSCCKVGVGAGPSIEAGQLERSQHTLVLSCSCSASFKPSC